MTSMQLQRYRKRADELFDPGLSRVVQRISHLVVLEIHKDPAIRRAAHEVFDNSDPHDYESEFICAGCAVSCCFWFRLRFFSSTYLDFFVESLCAASKSNYGKIVFYSN